MLPFFQKKILNKKYAFNQVTKVALFIQNQTLFLHCKQWKTNTSNVLNYI